MTIAAQEFVERGFERDKRDYWSMREELLAQHAGKWVAVHNGRVVAVGNDPLSIMEKALVEDGYAYTNKVGEEEKIVIRHRSAANQGLFSKYREGTRIAPSIIHRAVRWAMTLAAATAVHIETVPGKVRCAFPIEIARASTSICAAATSLGIAKE